MNRLRVIQGLRDMHPEADAAPAVSAVVTDDRLGLPTPAERSPFLIVLAASLIVHLGLLAYATYRSVTGDERSEGGSEEMILIDGMTVELLDSMPSAPQLAGAEAVTETETAEPVEKIEPAKPAVVDTKAVNVDAVSDPLPVAPSPAKVIEADSAQEPDAITAEPATTDTAAKPNDASETKAAIAIPDADVKPAEIDEGIAVAEAPRAESPPAEPAARVRGVVPARSRRGGDCRKADRAGAGKKRHRHPASAAGQRRCRTRSRGGHASSTHRAGRDPGGELAAAGKQDADADKAFSEGRDAERRLCRIRGNPGGPQFGGRQERNGRNVKDRNGEGVGCFVPCQADGASDAPSGLPERGRVKAFEGNGNGRLHRQRKRECRLGEGRAVGGERNSRPRGHRDGPTCLAFSADPRRNGEHGHGPGADPLRHTALRIAGALQTKGLKRSGFSGSRRRR